MTKGRIKSIRVKTVLFTTVALALAIATFLGAFTSCKKEEQSDRALCISATKRAVRTELGDADFNFCPDSEFSVRKQDDGSYKVRGSLIEKKSDTGKKVTHYFTAIIRGESFGDVTLIWG